MNVFKMLIDKVKNLDIKIKKIMRFGFIFSFILSIPAILGANVLEIPELLSTPIASAEIIAYICGMIAALVSGILAMKLLLYISKKTNFRIFSYYCLIVGIIALIFG